MVQNAKNANVIQKVREISPKAEVTIYDNQALSDIVKSVVERRNEIKNEIDVYKRQTTEGKSRMPFGNSLKPL